jgi:chromosome partitioning protein
VIGRDAGEALKTAGLAVLRSELGFRVAYQESPAAGLGVTAYDSTGEAAAEVRAMTDEVLALVGLPPSPKGAISKRRKQTR